MGPQLSVVIPTLNEAGNVGPLLARLGKALEGVAHEVILVDDGSTDGTVEAARASRPDVRIIARSGERGLATAVVRGLQEAHGAFVAVMDADLQHPPEVVPQLLDAAVANEADLVLASRFVNGGAAEGLNPARQVVSSGARAMALVLLPTIRAHRVRDSMTGFFLVRRATVEGVDLRPWGYKILLEILGRAPVRRVCEVGYVFEDRHAGTSKLGVHAILAYTAHVLRLAAADRENHRLARFGLVGLSGLAVNLVLLYALTELAGLYYLLSGAIALEASILNNYLWNDRFTFRDRRQRRWYNRLWRFNTVSLAAFGINLAVLFALTEFGGIHYLWSEVAAVAVAFAFNYGANHKWTWRALPAAQEAPPGPQEDGRGRGRA